MFKRAIKRNKMQNYAHSINRKVPAEMKRGLTWLDDIRDEPIHVSAKHEPCRPTLKVVKPKPLSVACQSPSENGIGIFSETKLYYDFIRSSLQILEVNIKHFDHPRTFLPINYSFYDDIPAWVIFLSDGSDYQFLDQFLDRYVEKPTLFLSTQISRVKTVDKINQFIAETELFNSPDITGQKRRMAFA